MALPPAQPSGSLLEETMAQDTDDRRNDRNARLEAARRDEDSRRRSGQDERSARARRWEEEDPERWDGLS
jgi:hypothetical protein